MSELVWYKLDKMSQNHDIGDHEELPQIGPLIMDMKQQQRYILAGVLKVNTIELSYVHENSHTAYETHPCQKINAFCFLLQLDIEKSNNELFQEATELFQNGKVTDDDARRIQDAFSDLHLKAIRR